MERIWIPKDCFNLENTTHNHQILNQFAVMVFVRHIHVVAGFNAILISPEFAAMMVFNSLRIFLVQLDWPAPQPPKWPRVWSIIRASGMFGRPSPSRASAWLLPFRDGICNFPAGWTCYTLLSASWLIPSVSSKVSLNGPCWPRISRRRSSKPTTHTLFTMCLLPECIMGIPEIKSWNTCL